MFTLPDLPYKYSDLEPFVDTETMQIHHDKHHGAYVKNTNDALTQNPELLEMEPQELYLNLDKVPEAVRTKVKNNLGGHINHSLFWELLIPASDYKDLGEDTELYKKITTDFGDWQGFQTKFEEQSISRFGSGWVWLVLKDGKLNIVSTANQDNPVLEGYVVLLGLDVWEHAYYLKYKNVRVDYVRAWWNIVNWAKAEELFTEVVKNKGGEVK